MIEEFLIKGYTPKEILQQGFKFYRYEKMIKSAFIDKRIEEMPIRKDLICEYHVGASGTGKTFYYNQLCETEGADNIYLMTDYDNQASGGLDDYLKSGAPPTLFLDEYKGQGISYGKLLTMLSEYSRMQTHSRYSNTYNLWTRCIITSIYPPEELYNIMVPENQRKSDSFKQLLRRLTKIVYHYKDGNDYKTFSISGNDYVDYDTLKQMAYEENGNNGFVAIENEQTDCPFDT